MSFSAGFSRGVQTGSALADMWDDSKEEKRQKEQTEMYRGLSSDMSAYGYPDATKYKALASQAGAYGDLDQQQQFDDLSKQFEQEGIAETLKYLDAGQPDKALEFYNNSGGDRAKSIRYDRENDPDTIYFVDAEGNEGSVPRRALEARTMSGLQALGAQKAAMAKKGERAHDLKKIRVKGEEARKTAGFKAKNGADGTTAQRKYNEMLTLGVPDEVARGVAFGTYRSVTDPATGATAVIDLATGREVGQLQMDDQGNFNWVSNLPGQAPEQAGMPRGLAEDRAKAETEARDPFGPNFLRPGAMKEAYGGLTPEEWKTRRLQELMQGGQGRGLTPPNESGASSQAPVELPPQAAQQLKEGVVTTFANGQRWTLSNGRAQRVE